MPKKIDLTGRKFGRWTVIDLAPRYSTGSQTIVRWNCVCECGAVRAVAGGSLRSGVSKSCGCLNLEKISERFSKTWDQKLWDRLDHRPNGCWEFTGSLNEWGYGTITEGLAHRKAYKLRYGDPGVRMVLHLCDNPKCCNPEHLFLGDNAANMDDMKKKGRGRSRPGAHHFRAKFTQDQVRELRERYKAGDVTQQQLADEYNVNRKTIERAVNGVSYKENPRLPRSLRAST